MAIRVAIHRTCDRCAHPFDESTVKYGDPLPKFSHKTLRCVLEKDPAGSDPDEVLFRFEDLCPDCDRVVEGYLKKIRLDEEDAPKRRKNKTDKTEEKPVEEAKAPEVAPPAVETPPAEVTKFEKPSEEVKASKENPHPF